MTSVNKLVSAYVDVDLDVEDVIEFIEDADKDDLDSILESCKKALSEYPDYHDVFEEFDKATIRYLVNRANQFGIQDMLLELKQAGEKVGAYLNLKAVNHE